MKNNIRKFVGWFGVLTPVYAAGALTVLFVFGNPGADLVSQILVVSGVNFFVGRRILKTTVVTKEVKRHGNQRAH